MRLRAEDRDFSPLMGGTIVADYDGYEELCDDEFMNVRFMLRHLMKHGKTSAKRKRVALVFANFLGMTPKDFE